jgi:Lon protease-like protein
MELALFPLRTVLFPGAPLPLHVFEQRYRVMMDQVLAGDRTFGVIAIRKGSEAGGYAETYRVGCLAAVEQLQRAEDGTMTMIVRGVKRFWLEDRLPDDPFPHGEVAFLADPDGELPARELIAARAAVHKYLSVVARIQGTEVLAPSLPEDPVGASFALAEVLEVDLADRQRLLEAADARARLGLIAELARTEAGLLEFVGPSVGRPGESYHPN